MNLNKEKLKKNPISVLVQDDLLRNEVKFRLDNSGYSMSAICQRLREAGVAIDKTRLSRYLSLTGEKNGLTDEILIALCKFLGISIELKVKYTGRTEKENIKELLIYINGLKEIRKEKPKRQAESPIFDPDADF